MSASIRTQITARIAAMLATLTPYDSRTGVGVNVRVGLRTVAAMAAPCVVLTPGPDRSVPGYGNSLTETEYAVTAYVNRKESRYADYIADPAAEWALVDAMIADIRGLMETSDATLAALVEHIGYRSGTPAYSEDGGEIIGAEIRYSVQYRIDLGDPDNQPNQEI